MPCPDDNSLSEFMNGLLSGERRRAIERHLDTCASCTQVLVGVGKALGQPAPSSPGARIGRYEITEYLGRGAMGTVYAATDTMLHRSVAIKVLHASLDELPGARERSLREARALARLSHPNVVAIHDVGEHEGSIYLAMERLYGCTLTEWLASGTRPWRNILDVFLQAAAGLSAAHQAGIVHRDFKPDNVFVTHAGRVCVMDLGLARAEARSPDNELRPFITDPPAAVTQSGTLVGTPAYMSPEQLEARVATPLSDQFSFCVALHEALYGARPYHAPTPRELLAHMQAYPTLAPSPRTSGVPEWIFPIVAQGLAIDPRRRHESMQVLERRVRKHLRASAVPYYLNAGFQLLMLLPHLGITTLFTWALLSPSGLPSPHDPGSSSGAAHSVAVILTVWLVLLFFTGWAPLGVIWTPINIYGLLRKRRWAVISTLIYWGFATLTCLGTPLALVGIATLWRLRKKTATSPESVRP